MNQQKIGKFIAERRKEKKLTQVDLAEKLGVSNRTISKWENGNSLPDYSMFQDLCNELDISINELLSGEKLSEENYQKKLEENFVSTIDYNNKKRNRKFVKLFFFCVIISFIYLLYKIFIAYFYYADINPDIDPKTFPNNSNISTVKIENNGLDNIVALDKLHLYIPEEFELVTDKTKSSYVMDGCEPYVKGLVDKDDYDALILVCNRDHSGLNNIDYYGINVTLFPLLIPYNLFEKYDIHSTIDLIHFYERHSKFKANVFTSSDDIKINFIARQYVRSVLPSYDHFYYLENDLTGYSIDYSSRDGRFFQEAVIMYTDDVLNERTFSISFHNKKEDYFDSKNSFDIINSIS